MDAKSSKDKQMRGYHHGNLRTALLDSAISMIQAEPGKAISLRSVAAHAGVSSTAPYRHFEDREALLTAIATIGFERIREAVDEARTRITPDGAVAAVAGAYLTFASENEGLYLIMFTENHLEKRYDDAYAKRAEEAFQVLEQAVQGRLVEKDSEHVRLIATVVWATLHGTAMLSFKRLTQHKISSGESAQGVIGERIIQVLIDGLLPGSAKKQA
jgi:AcrR family transcriptional regulator